MPTPAMQRRSMLCANTGSTFRRSNLPSTASARVPLAGGGAARRADDVLGRRCARSLAVRRTTTRGEGVASAVVSPRRLLVRDLGQVATPAGREAPLRGAALGEVDVVEDAYVLCEDDVIAAVGRMRDLGLLDGEVEELYAGGRSAVPGLVDCHTHPAFGGDRVEEFSLRAAGASYEELHAAGGGILSTVHATRAAGTDGLRTAVERHRAWMLAAGTTTFEAKSGYGLDHDTELAQLRVVRAAGGVPTWLGAHAVPPR